jgi:glycosyltransferase involved in cell wall biosynthesis
MTTTSTLSAAGPSARSRRLTDDVTVVVPVRNAEGLVDDCLRAVLACRPAGVVVVDGLSTDGTLEKVRAHPVRVLSDEGKGLPAARMLGVQAASTRYVALVDVDVVLRDEHALEQLLAELVDDRYDALQAGQESVSGDGYWGQALVHHHRNGRSREWFGLVCTVMERELLLAHGFDPTFTSGEDIELRWRLRSAGLRTGVSRRTVVDHRFAADDFAFARDQFLMDGRGLGRMLRKDRGVRGAALVALPAAAAVRGIAVSVRRGKPRFIPYFLCYAAYNYAGMVAPE